MFPQDEFEGIELCLVETDFVEWLQAELDKRQWNQSDLARAGGMTPGQVARVMAGTRGFGKDFLAGVATALNLPVEYVFRKAGWLPSYGEMLPEARDWSARLMLLSPERRAAVMQAIENILGLAENRDPPPRRGRSGGGSSE